MHHRIGGLLLLAGSTGFGLLLILGLSGNTIGTADNLVTGIILLATAASAGVGTGFLAIDGSERRAGGAVRFGLGLVAASLLGLIAGELWVIVFPIQGDPLSSPLILVFAGAYLSLIVGQVVVGLALLKRGGPRRITGGLVCLGSWLSYSVRRTSSSAVVTSRWPYGLPGWSSSCSAGRALDSWRFATRRVPSSRGQPVDHANPPTRIPAAVRANGEARRARGRPLTVARPALASRGLPRSRPGPRQARHDLAHQGRRCG
jgi:hypothetical protein